MRKFLALVLIVGMVGFIAGCGQQATEIKSTIPQPENLTIRGTVRGLNNSGVVGDPIEGTFLKLDGDSISRTAQTDVNGDYAFEGLPEGTYIITATKEGFQRNIGAAVVLSTPVAGAPVSSNDYEVVNDIGMVNLPVILSISPDLGTVVSAATLEITVVFNEAMETASVIPAFAPNGLRAFDMGDNQGVISTWSSDNKTLTITTTGPLLANKYYGLAVDSAGTAQDVDGNILDVTGGAGTGGGGLLVALYNNIAGVSYRTASGGAPSAPTNLRLSVNGTTEVDYLDVNGGGEAVNLWWLATTATSEITGYNIWIAPSASGPWSYLNTSSVNYLASTTNAINTALYGATWSTVNATCVKQLAFVTTPVHFKVVAFNGEGESAGATASERDVIGPSVAGAVRSPGGIPNLPAGIASALRDYNIGDGHQNDGCYVYFSEPMDLTTVTDNNDYRSNNVAASATVVYNGFSTTNAPLTVVELTFAAQLVPLTYPLTVEASGGVLDLSGNSSKGGTDGRAWIL